MIKAAIYARVSKDEQAQRGYSLPLQVKDCKAKAEELGVPLIEEFIDDGYSGAFLDRPAMNQLRKRLNEFQLVLCYDPDRLARNLTHQLIITEEIEKAGAKLEFINFDWENTPEGRLFYSIRGAVSAYEREKIRERSMRGIKAKAEAGKVIKNNNAYGYTFDPETSSYIIHEQEAKMIRNIFKWYTEEEIGMLRIAERLHQQGFETRTGVTHWATSSVNNILKNEMYIGTAWAFKTSKKKVGPRKYETVHRPPEDWVAIPVPPIIDKETWNKAQQQSKTNLTKSSRNTHYEYLLRGLVHCPSCDATMQLTHGKKNEPKYRYFCCPTGKQHNAKGLPPVPRCKIRNIPAWLLEEMVWDELIAISKEPDILDSLIQKQQEPSDNTEIVEQIKALHMEQKKLNKAKDRVLKFMREELLSEEDAQQELKTIKTQSDSLLRSQRLLESKLAETKVESNLDELKAKLNLLSSGLETAPFDLKQKAISSIVSKVVAERVDMGFSRYDEPEIKIDIQLKL